MLIKNLPLSKSDFSSGRFSQLADFVSKNWPSPTKPTHEESLNIIAITFGYASLEDASNNASEELHIKYSDRDLYAYSPIENLSKQMSRLDEDSKPSSHEFWMKVSTRYNEAQGFYSTWPHHLISRWNYNKVSLNLTDEMLGWLESDFDSIWCNNSKRHYSLFSANFNTNTAATIVTSLGKDLSLEHIEKTTIHENLDEDLIDALYQDAMSILLEQIMSMGSMQLSMYANLVGFSGHDFLAIANNAIGFPNLYEHMRRYLREKILPRKLITLFVAERGGNGFFRSYCELNVENFKAPDLYPIDDGKFAFQVQRVFGESTDFKSYSWKGVINSNSGELLAIAEGSYITGPASRGSSGFGLIDALDEVGDRDVEIVDLILDVLQDDIKNMYGEHIKKHDINMHLLFKDGNILTIASCERSKNSTKGIGMRLIHECITRLKQKYRRNIHVAMLINPLQYKPDAILSKSISSKRQMDIEKIANTALTLEEHPNVLNIYAKGCSDNDGISTFFRYIFEAEE
jgi:hypothetical protein